MNNTPKTEGKTEEKPKLGKRLDGKKTSEKIRNSLKEKIKTSLTSQCIALSLDPTNIDDIKDERLIKPCLAVILVGSRKDSETYVNFKKKACKEIGIVSVSCNYKDDVAEEELIKKIKELNNDDNVDGILVQLPLPKHINEENIINNISPLKDVDGLHPYNSGLLMQKGVKAPFIPCTPYGIIELLDEYKIDCTGKKAVVLGRSILVGKPISLLLQSRNATVTMCHSRTKDLKEEVLKGDIVVVAIGRPLFVKADWLKPGCIVIDVGINSIDAPERKRGYRLVGDVDYKPARKVASMITPVPGGCGPMTVAMLMKNTVKSFQAKAAKKK